MIVPLATATEITKRYANEAQNYIFRVSMVDREQGALLVAYAHVQSKRSLDRLRQIDLKEAAAVRWYARFRSTSCSC